MRNIFKTFINSLFARSKGDETGKVSSTASSSVRNGVINLMPHGDAMNVATVFRCVDVLAGSVSSLPILVEKRKGEIYVEDNNSELGYLLNIQPSKYMCAPDFWRVVVQDMLLDGNAYIVPLKDNETGEVWQLTRVSPMYVTHDTICDEYTVTDVEAGIHETFKEKEIIHLKNYSKDGKTGISTLSFARIATETAASGESETLSRFVNGGNVRGLVSDDASGVRGFGEYQDAELQKTAESLDEKFSRGEKIVSLPGAAKFSPITLSSQDMQFLESRKFNGLDICRFFNVPPQFVFYDTASNYKSAEMANVAFLSNTLNPLLRKIETELMRKLVMVRRTGKYRIRFDREGLFAADLDSRAKYLSSMIGIGMYTVNELRAKENKAAVEGGDKVLVSANLKDINEMGAADAEETKKDDYGNDVTE